MDTSRKSRMPKKDRYAQRSDRGLSDRVIPEVRVALLVLVTSKPWVVTRIWGIDPT